VDSNTIDNDSTQTEQNAAPETETRKGFAAFLNKTAPSANLDHDRLFKAIPFILFLVFLAMVHISNNHSGENKIRRIERMEKEMKEYRWEYMTTKSEMMLKSRQSELARLVEANGIKELRTPPQKIVIKKDEHK
jgi:hypothetical protein